MSEPFISQICMFGCNFAPRGWAFCNGQLLPISQNTALFSLLGTNFGGDGRTTVGLPDLQSRVPMHFGQGPGLTYRPLGQKSGNEYTTLTTATLPVHNHVANTSTLTTAASQVTVDVKGSSAASTTTSPDGAVNAIPGSGRPAYAPAPGDVTMQSIQATVPSAGVSGSVTIENAGASQSFSNLPPFQAVNFCIALVGLFPSRN